MSDRKDSVSNEKQLSLRAENQSLRAALMDVLNVTGLLIGTEQFIVENYGTSGLKAQQRALRALNGAA